MSTDSDLLCCFGAGGHGVVVATQWAARRGAGGVVFGDEQAGEGSFVGGVQVRFTALEQVGQIPLLVTIGDNARRRALLELADRRGMVLECFVADPLSYFTDRPGAGSIVLAGAVVNARATIGRGVIVNSCSVVEHDCVVGDFVHLSPNATVAGGASIGAGSWIGAGAVVLPGVRIAAGCVIGAGCVVTRDIEQSATYVGVPARRVAPTNAGE